MSSASPSGASSHATQTGRPSLWTASDQRKLGRLYVYTTLPIKKILDVIQASSPDGGPGKDSANKKLNALLDKEPRWLHPRTRTDMERRMNELGHSPTRHRPQDAIGSHQLQGDSAPIEAPPQQPPYEAGLFPIAGIPQDAYDNTIMPFEYESGPHISFAPFSNETGTTGSAMDIATNNQHSRFTPSFGRKTTGLSTSSIMSSTTLKRALSGYSTGFVRQVTKVIKRYTMPANASQDTSPISETRPSSADSMRGSWIYDEHAPTDMSTAPLMPGEFLNMDRLLQQEACVEGSPEHEARSCLCRPAAEIVASCWMSESGPSSRALSILANKMVCDADRTDRDVFGNTVLHLLAARDAPHQDILQLVSSGVDHKPRNSAGQTFLHLLSPSWLDDFTSLITLLSNFQSRKDSPFFYARDIYGQTFLHVLRSKIEDPTIFNKVLETFNITLLRDAFDSRPTCQDIPIQPLRRAFTSVAAPEINATTIPRIRADPVYNQGRILRYVSKACLDPGVEDEYGRNGLHCLAAAILSEETLLWKYGNPGTTQQGNSRKRKREPSPPRLKHSDSSKDRLTVRENIVNNLIAANVKINHYDEDGNTVLMAFVAQLPEDDDYKVPVSILQLLIDNGADLDARNRRGETALHIAVRRGRKLAMRTLVQAGANVHVRDGNGRSLLDVADEKMRSETDNKMYMHYEACRAWLSGQGRAVQNPTVVQEWALSGASGRSL